jgi:hypothetical protein
MHKLRNFLALYRLYAAYHPRRYAARIAFGMAFKGLPF